MLNNLAKDCDICHRLGRQECGYHRFKQMCLSQMAQGSPPSQPPRPPPPQHSPPASRPPQQYREQPVRTQNVYRSEVFTQNQRPEVQKVQQFQSARRQEAFHGQNRQFQGDFGARSVHSVYQGQQHHYNGPMPPETNMMRVEQNGQVLYYPIYPVYEVVYEPLDPTSGSSILSHSSLNP